MVVFKMLKLSKKVEYGIIALKHLLNQPKNEFARAKEIAEAYNIPQEVMAKILQTLTRQGIVRSIQGARGGYVLAKSGKEIKLSNVIECIDGPVGLVDCVNEDNKDCEQIVNCNIIDPLRVIQEQFLIFLSKISLEEINNEIEMQKVSWLNSS